MSGIDLIQLMTGMDMPVGSVVFCDPYWNIMGYPDSYMRNVYSASDVLLSPSFGEGFGLPILEAQACGTPVIVNDCTSMPELCFAGWKTTGQRIYSGQNSWQFAPNIDSILDCLEQAYDKRGDEKLRRDARIGAEAYDADLVTTQYWKPVLDEIEQEITSGGGLELLGVNGEDMV
jgi:glycosyltransferase involved in cell wall biosynthesis